MLGVAGVAVIGILLSVVPNWSGFTAQAQNGPPPFHAHHGHKVLLPGSVPRALRQAKRLGHENPARQLQLTIALQLPDPNGLDALLADQRNPSSPQYHKYLTSQDFIKQFAPSQQSVTAVRQFLTSAGLKVTGVSANRTLIDATGSLAQAEQTFGVTIGQYKLGNRQVYAPDEPPQIPDSLASILLDVAGLDNLLKAYPIRNSDSAQAGRSEQTLERLPAALPHVPASGPIPGSYGPTELRGGYDVANLISAGGTGNGQRVAVYELAPYIPNDIASYRSQYGLPSSTLNPISVDLASPTCASGGSPCDNGSGIIEADLDIEVVSALAPNATQDIYTAPNDSRYIDGYNKIVVDNLDAVTTTSWGLCEPLTGSSRLRAQDQIFAQGAAQGQSFFAASGDGGSDDCSHDGVSGFPPTVDSPASDPYVLGVGGTTLTLSGGSYGGETTWNHNGGAGGGGISSYFDQSPWQLGAGVANTFSTGEREVPDVAANADPNTGDSVYCSSMVECFGPLNPWVIVGGTSAAAPLWAGVLTDINTYLIAHAVSSLGWANQTLYQLFSNGQTFTPYHDITTGNNDIDYFGPPYGGDYPATACYDLTTGIGSPDAWNIARDAGGGVHVGGGGPCPNTAPPVTNLVHDGGFEQAPASSPWAQFSIQDFPVIVSFSGAHTGSAAFVPCAYPICDDRVSQTLTIPAGTIHQAKLRFWLETFSDLPVLLPNPPCVDHVYATLATTDGTVLPGGGSVLASCESSPVFGYLFESFDVTSLLQAHVGGQLVLSFRGTTSNEAAVAQFYTFWSIDDVSLNVS